MVIGFSDWPSKYHVPSTYNFMLFFMCYSSICRFEQFSFRPTPFPISSQYQQLYWHWENLIWKRFVQQTTKSNFRTYRLLWMNKQLCLEIYIHSFTACTFWIKFPFAFSTFECVEPMRSITYNMFFITYLNRLCMLHYFVFELF